MFQILNKYNVKLNIWNIGQDLLAHFEMCNKHTRSSHRQAMVRFCICFFHEFIHGAIIIPHLR